MRASELYEALIKEISGLLREQSFSRDGYCFYIRRDSNWGLIGFQKSRKSTADDIIFSINLGVCSGRLMAFFSSGSCDKKPSIESCHWRERIGVLMPAHQDKWWRVRSSDSIDSLVNELKECLMRVAIPTIQQHLCDEQLCSEWCSGQSPGLTDIQRLVNLSVLLKARGADRTYCEIVEEMKKTSAGKPTASIVRQHLQHLEQVRPDYGI